MTEVWRRSAEKIVFSAWRRTAKSIEPIDFRQLHRATAADAFRDRFDDAHVLQTFFAGRVGLLVVPHAVGHVVELVCELIALRNLDEVRVLRLREHAEPMIRKRWIHPERAVV